jgi:hypothetical protein
MMIERELTKDELATWNDLKDDDDKEDLNEGNLKKIEKKFEYCHRDLSRKKGSAIMKEESLISLETIAQNHPSLKFLNHTLIAEILKKREIETFKIK